MSHEPVSIDDKIYQSNDKRAMSVRELLSSFRRQSIARVTDLHIKVGKAPCFRMDGALRITEAAPLDAKTIKRMMKALLDDHQVQTLLKTRSVNASRLIDDMRFRINAYFDMNGPAMAIRALDTNLPSIDFVGFPNNVWQDIAKLTQGLVLVTGTTGAGKSTTIAALLNYIAHHRPVHIITLEDPIEYELKSDISMISQRAIGRDVPNFEVGLRDCLREDPDIIFVGEMTDRESATWTMTAAETGHLVFSGIHTRDASGTLTRLLDMYPPDRAEEVANKLAHSVRFIISQKLVQRDDKAGRRMAMEVLNNTYGVSNLIRQARSDQIYSLMQTQTRDEPGQRMSTMERSLAKLVAEGIISVAEAERHANHQPVLADELSRLNLK
ncbi:MAG: PilT/PilU family type 4a pilus ATPase [Phycisphaerales bacterium]|nr:PilT/PilU family type 4a pilus ATPase [Phycisphaerales bacterium]